MFDAHNRDLFMLGVNIGEKEHYWRDIVEDLAAQRRALA